MKISRRKLLLGVGGAALSLPILESFSGGRAAAASEYAEPYAIFFRQANGVAQAQTNGIIGSEPERFWPEGLGALTPENMAGRATGELVSVRDKLLMIRGVNGEGFLYGDGHARGAMQSLTAAGPVVAEAGGDSEANGISIDQVIAQQLNAEGRDPLVLFAGQGGGWLNGACLSYTRAGMRSSAQYNPWAAYMTLVGGAGGLSAEAQLQLARRQRSVNDLVRDQMDSLLRHPRLSSSDRYRLEQHRTAIRDLEGSLSCRLSEDQERMLETGSSVYDSTNGDEVLATARLHMDVAALAIACGYTRAVVIQVGTGNDGRTRYRNPDTGSLMENYHYLSHRRASHDNSGTPIADSDRLHHLVDVQFAQTFLHLVQTLDSYVLPDGETLLDQGVACWMNDNANGPPHSIQGIPWILAGSAQGAFRQGEVVELGAGSPPIRNHDQLLNTIGAAVGATSGGTRPLDDFGQTIDGEAWSEPRGALSGLLT